MSDIADVLTITNSPDGLTLVGEVDGRTSDRLQRALTPLLSDGASSTHRLDLSGVDFMDSSGLRILLAATDTARKQGGDIVLAGVQPTVARLLELSQLDTHFTIESSDHHPNERADEPDSPV